MAGGSRRRLGQAGAAEGHTAAAPWLRCGHHSSCKGRSHHSIQAARSGCNPFVLSLTCGWSLMKPRLELEEDQHWWRESVGSMASTE